MEFKAIQQISFYLARFTEFSDLLASSSQINFILQIFSSIQVDIKQNFILRTFMFDIEFSNQIDVNDVLKEKQFWKYGTNVTTKALQYLLSSRLTLKLYLHLIALSLKLMLSLCSANSLHLLMNHVGLAGLRRRGMRRLKLKPHFPDSLTCIMFIFVMSVRYQVMQFE